MYYIQSCKAKLPATYISDTKCFYFLPQNNTFITAIKTIGRQVGLIQILIIMGKRDSSLLYLFLGIYSLMISWYYNHSLIILLITYIFWPLYLVYELLIGHLAHGMWKTIPLSYFKWPLSDCRIIASLAIFRLNTYICINRMHSFSSVHFPVHFFWSGHLFTAHLLAVIINLSHLSNFTQMGYAHIF